MAGPVPENWVHISVVDEMGKHLVVENRGSVRGWIRPCNTPSPQGAGGVWAHRARGEPGGEWPKSAPRIGPSSVASGTLQIGKLQFCPRRAQAAVLPRVRLGVVLLMVVLRVEELWCRHDLRRDLVPAQTLESLLKDGLRLLGDPALLLGVVVDSGSVLRPPVVALLVQRGGVMALPEDLQQLGIGDNLWVVHDSDHLVVIRGARAHIPVRGIWNAAAGVANLRGVDALHLHVEILRAPEAAHPEHSLLHARRPRRVHLRALDEVLRVSSRCIRYGSLRALRRAAEEGARRPGVRRPAGATRATDEALCQQAAEPEEEQRRSQAALRRAAAPRHRAWMGRNHPPPGGDSWQQSLP
eukprot:CAMPEP_0204517894 /NCGR_PEP_ID=MMETSP0661-20131031/3906_1 /ASSEMBLY_ACC=CAM_ASM_000606 /TAXON_ID=109239 /ORGANISM="Alexandrium margalefi, Strain AMGDE01CS-322" /LENGTH=354 /DNA_ID=CAMNT_0051523309 /DNA_START=35 /DNA_END=1099 /DNA_ORIENTATION=+